MIRGSPKALPWADLSLPFQGGGKTGSRRADLLRPFRDKIGNTGSQTQALQ